MKRRTSFRVSLIYKKRAKSENPQAIKGSTCSSIVNRQFLVCIPQAKIFLRFRRPLNENFQNLKRQTKSLQIYSVSSWRAKYKLFVSFNSPECGTRSSPLSGFFGVQCYCYSGNWLGKTI